jgi:hypothetical protein
MPQRFHCNSSEQACLNSHFMRIGLVYEEGGWQKP